MAQDINQVKLEIQQKINELLGDENDAYQQIFDTLNRSNATLVQFEQLLKDVKKTVRELNGDLSYTVRIFEDLIEKLKEENKLLQLQDTLISKANRIIRETIDIRKGEQYADKSRIESLQRQIDLELIYLEKLKNSRRLTSEEKEDVKNQIKGLKDTKDELDGILDTHKYINENLGIQARSASILDGLFSKMGLPDLGFKEAYQDTVKMGQAVVNAGFSFNAAAHYSKLIGNNLKTALLGAPLFILGELLDALIKGDKATGDLAKDFNLTYNEAANLRGELIEIGNLSGNVALNARALQESMVAVGKSLGSNAKLNEEDLETFTELRELAGYTNEELIGMQKMSLAMNKPLKDNVKSFLGTTAALNAQNKLTINEKQLLKEVADTSAAIKLSTGGTAEDLAKAAFRAKQFGINLEQADRIAESLLDFESSISNELSAELLTGRDLNLERARLLALNGNIAGASAEILRQVKGSAEFTAMNRIQQEAIAKAVGMSREDLAKSLIEREALAALGDKDKTGLEAYNRLKKEGLSDDQIAAKLGDEEYTRQLKQQSIQERFNASVEKLKEIFISIAEPVLQIVSPFVDILLPVLSTISGVVGSIVSIFKGGTEQLTTWQKLIASTLVAFTTIKAITLATTLLQTRSLALRAQDLIIAAQIKAFEIQTAVAKMTGSGAASFGITAAIGLAAGAAAYAYLSSMKDGEIDYSEGPVVTGGFGSVQLSPKDTGFFNGEKIIAGTNLGGNNTTQQDISPLIQELKNLRQDINNLNNRPIHVGIDVDGQKLASAVAQYPTTFNTNFNRKAVKA